MAHAKGYTQCGTHEEQPACRGQGTKLCRETEQPDIHSPAPSIEEEVMAKYAKLGPPS